MELNLDMKVAEIEYDRYVKDMELLIGKTINQTVKVVTVTKNNGCIRKGLRIEETETNMNPQIYLEEIYREQSEKEGTLQDSVDEFLKIYQTTKHDSIRSDFYEWEQVKERVTARIINAEWNKELLEEIPHRKVLDLAIIYQIVLKMNGSASTTLMIRKEHLEQWGVSEKELQENAEKNSENLFPAEMKRMREVICEMIKIDEEEIDELDDTIYVLTNQYRMFGAVTLFYQGILEKIGEMLETDFVVIPSSIHEIIILKNTRDIDRMNITEMIRSVNEEQVRREEQLADHPYYYSIKNKQLSL